MARRNGASLLNPRWVRVAHQVEQPHRFERGRFYNASVRGTVAGSHLAAVVRI